MADDSTTYFSLYSADQSTKVTDLLRSLDVLFYFQENDESHEMLKNWGAWDASSPHPHKGYHLFVRDTNVQKIGSRLVELNRILGNSNDGLSAQKSI